jgi:hypothetical protein
MFPRITRRCMGTSFNITEKTIEEDNLLPALLGLFIGAVPHDIFSKRFRVAIELSVALRQRRRNGPFVDRKVRGDQFVG